jgi:hypothetical protein
VAVRNREEKIMAYKKENAMAATPGSEDEYLDVRRQNKEENPFTERNRRERPRMSDITRAVDKVDVYMPGTTFGNQPGAYEEGGQAGTSQTLPSPLGADKNTSASLLVLRFEIYDLLNRYSGDLGKTIKYSLMQDVERLFKEYTNS